ncbi:MAG: bifunctional DNA primase/polymerase, partial [Ligilactobacillus sp.]|nr:bifunctional DNA primase/polymerase [Ligilactobacillus sp.]
MTVKNTALELAKHGFKVFPLVPNTKRPIKDHSYLTASNDPQTVAKWFDDLPQANLGLELASKSLVVVDIDNHNSAGIRDTMQKMADQRCTLPTNTYIEQTPSGGLHFFYTGPAKK